MGGNNPPYHQDPSSTDKYHSWLKMKGQSECPECKVALLSKPGAVNVATDSPSTSSNNGLIEGNQPQEEKVFTVTKTTKDKRGYYLTETKTFIKPRSSGTVQNAKTIAYYLGNAKLVAYRSEFIEEGTLGLISQKRGADISDDPVTISKGRAEAILAWALYLLRHERLKHNPSVEVPGQITLSKRIRELYRQFVLAEKTRESNAQRVDPHKYDQAMVDHLVEEEIAIDANEQERWEALSLEEQEAELRRMEEEDKKVNEMVEDEMQGESGRKGETQE